ncbi:MAG: hypothetical protein HZC54_12010 [Verrucomicrobia bacterium]|nr:hypothetical protein [Verrucomicrobiota bacterium]
MICFISDSSPSNRRGSKKTEPATDVNATVAGAISDYAGTDGSLRRPVIMMKASDAGTPKALGQGRAFARLVSGSDLIEGAHEWWELAVKYKHGVFIGKSCSRSSISGSSSC